MTSLIITFHGDVKMTLIDAARPEQESELRSELTSNSTEVQFNTSQSTKLLLCCNTCHNNAA